VQTKQSTTVSNDGTIVGGGVAVGIGDGPGFVTNTNYIRGNFGVLINGYGHGNSVDNSGTIQGRSGYGVR
jgi:hypothetical protein